MGQATRSAIPHNRDHQNDAAHSEGFEGYEEGKEGTARDRANQAHLVGGGGDLPMQQPVRLSRHLMADVNLPQNGYSGLIGNPVGAETKWSSSTCLLPLLTWFIHMVYSHGLVGL
jgi:hypothetical protein